MELEVSGLQVVGLAMEGELTGRCHHTLNEVICHLHQHLQEGGIWGGCVGMGRREGVGRREGEGGMGRREGYEGDSLPPHPHPALVLGPPLPPDRVVSADSALPDLLGGMTWHCVYT